MTTKETGEDVGRYVKTGFLWETAVFYSMWNELGERFGHDLAKEITVKVMVSAGRLMGEQAAEEIDTRGVRGVSEAWDLMHGPSPEKTLELTDDRFVYRNTGCPAFHLLKKLGVSDRDMSDMADALCAVDYGFAKAFGDDVECVHTSRLAKGDSYCEWVHTSSRKG